jgi:hypothetical protein
VNLDPVTLDDLHTRVKSSVSDGGHGPIAEKYDHQVPHSQYSLRENPKFLQNFRAKNNTLKEKF